MDADYNYDPYGLWNRYYYVWDKVLAALIVLCVVYPEKFYKWNWIVFFSFMVVRASWEVLAIEDYSNASRPSIIFLLFIGNTICCIIQFGIQWGKKLFWH